MTIQHHPSDLLLTGFAAGTLDHGTHIAVATHLVGCAPCRGWIRSLEQVGGAVLADLPPTAMSSDALARVEARLRQPAPAASARPASTALDDVPGLPAFVRRYRAGAWKWVAPRLHLRPIEVRDAETTRVFLLRCGAGVQLVEHTHSGVEMTCVLSGSFSHDGGRYGAGDFDLGDGSVDHRITIGAAEDCLCLVAMQGRLRLQGWLGRLMQPFVRI